MINYQLKPCCDECNYLKLDCTQETVCYWGGSSNVFLKTTITCEHQKVCGAYNEVTYTEVLNGNETAKK